MRGSSFVAVLCLLLAPTSDGLSNKKKRKKVNDTVHERRIACESQTCGHLVPLEAKNCVNECISPDCYRKTFAEPLEDGEINVQLSKNFMACARRDVQASTTSQRRSERQRAGSSVKSAAATSTAGDAATATVGASDGSTAEYVETDRVDAAATASDGDDDGDGEWDDGFAESSDEVEMGRPAENVLR